MGEMAGSQNISEEIQTVPEISDAIQDYVRDLPILRYLRCSKSHAIEVGQEYCGICGRSPVKEEPKRKPRIPRKITGNDQRQVQHEKFADINVRLNSVKLDECNDPDEKECVPGTSDQNSKTEPKTENAPDGIEEVAQTENSGNLLNDWADTEYFGVRRCENNHDFAADNDQCPFCGGFPVRVGEEFHQASLSEAEDDDDTFWEDECDVKYREEFGLLICKNGHLFHKSWHICNICGMQSKTASRPNRRPALNNQKEEDKQLTLGPFYIKEPVFFANGWISSYSTGKNKAALEDLLPKKRGNKIRPNVPAQKLDVGCSTGFQTVQRSMQYYETR